MLPDTFVVMVARVKLAFPEEFVPNLTASLVVLAILLLMGKLLFRAPYVLSSGREDDTRVLYVERTRMPPDVSRRSADPPLPVAAPQDQAAAPLQPTPQPGPALRPRDAPATAASSLAGELYTRGGRVRLPAEALSPSPAVTVPGNPTERDSRSAKQLLERPNPIDYRETRFEKDWVSDGTRGDMVAQKLRRGAQSLGKLVFGEDTQPAAPRPPPEVRFNPALHERSADLGSEKTGNAYKAAPIAFEKAPDLKGEASRRIRSAVGELEKRHAGCDSQRVKTLMAPVLSHLAELQRVEYAMAHGADPTQAAHLLPRTADNAYDQARRALWYAERQLASCRK